MEYIEAKDIDRVWISNDKYFESVLEVVWEFYIGSYQPANLEDILHFEKIIFAPTQTDRLMMEIDEIII